MHRVLTFVGRQLQQFQIGLVGHFLRMRFQQPIVGHAKIAGGKQFLAILVILERARLSHQRINHMPIVDRGSATADQSRHPLDEHALVRDLDELRRDLHVHLLTDQSAGHRIAVGSHSNRTALGHANVFQSFIGIQAIIRQPRQKLLFFGKAFLTRLVRLGDQFFQETHIVFATRKIPAPSQKQRLIDPAFEMAIRGFHIAVLVRTPRIGFLRFDSVMLHQRLVALGVRFSIRMIVDRCGQAVGAMPLGHAAELPKGFLNPRAQGLERFGKAEGNGLGVRVRQHAMKQRMIEPLPGDPHAEIVQDRKVAGGQPARMMHLLEHHRLSRPGQTPPLGHPPLEGSPGRIGILPRRLFLQPLEKRLGFETRFGLQAGLDFGPNRFKRIDTRAVIPRLFSL